MANDSLDLPASVVAWLSDGGARMAVNALLQVDDASLPPELEWRDLRSYHAARAAAALTRSEWVIALHDAWQTIWGDQIPSSWIVWSPAEMLENEWITVESAWDENSFTVRHEREGLLLFTAIEFAPDVTTLAFGLEPKVGDEILVQGQTKAFEWRGSSKDDWGLWNVARFAGNLATSVDLITSLLVAAQEAIQACEDAAGKWRDQRSG